LRLGSLFRPVADLGSGRIVGHRAGLVARDQAGHTVAFADAYARAVSAQDVVYFDRLVRTMHALNFLVQRRWSGGWLELAVHSRHLHAVAEGHGLVFEAVLKRCGLGSEDIILAIDGHHAGYLPHLGEALDNYRRRGYRLALENLDPAADADLPGRLRPELVHLLPDDGGGALFAACKAAGVAVVGDGIDDARDLARARSHGVTLGTGEHFGAAQRDCLPTHGVRRVA
jgi:EAL domain-containing protein (putative c-di-GMP-specific phosphodiesterase class I)